MCSISVCWDWATLGNANNSTQMSEEWRRIHDLRLANGRWRVEPGEEKFQREKLDFYILFFFFLSFLGLNLWHMEVPRLGGQIGAAAASLCHSHSNVGLTYATAHGNAGSLTHWARPGIRPAASWILVEFVIAEPPRELQMSTFFIWTRVLSKLSV